MWKLNIRWSKGCTCMDGAGVIRGTQLGRSTVMGRSMVTRMRRKVSPEEQRSFLAFGIYSIARIVCFLVFLFFCFTGKGGGGGGGGEDQYHDQSIVFRNEIY